MIDLVASQRHYYDHLRPVWLALPAETRGDVWLAPTFRAVAPRSRALPAAPERGRVVLVASFDDLRSLPAGVHPILFEHGVGQSYSGARDSASAAGYAGGTGRHLAAAFLHPNRYAADRDRAAYPDTPVEVVGYPRLATLQTIGEPPRGMRPTVAVTFHWHAPLCVETSSGFGFWWDAVKELAHRGDVEVLGHAHPRLLPQVERYYGKAAIEVVPRFEDVLARAEVLAFDNTSAGYEFAQVRGPVVVLDNPGYRRGVHHGLRFWDAADIGPRISEPADLAEAVERALSGPWPGAAEALERVFPPVEDPAATAAAAVLKVVDRLRAVPTTV